MDFDLFLRIFELSILGIFLVALFTMTIMTESVFGLFAIFFTCAISGSAHWLVVFALGTCICVYLGIKLDRLMCKEHAAMLSNQSVSESP